MVARLSSSRLPVLVGLRGYELGEDERGFIAARKPVGFLLFARNIQSPAQVQRLCGDIVDTCGYQPLIAVDQEGGRVQRLTFGGRLPAARLFGEWAKEAPSDALEGCMISAQLLAAQLREVGANLLLGPVLDLGLPETHAVIGDRAFSAQPERVAELGEAYLNGVARGGCWGCIKHAPGHGRAAADSHFELPRVGVDMERLEADFLPFRTLAAQADFMMTAHVVFDAIEEEVPATYSSRALHMMKSGWGFKGIVFADDIGMQALQGPYLGRAERALQAGCDIAIAALSVVRHGMEGTVFDEASFQLLREGELPGLAPPAWEVLERMVLPVELSPQDHDEARARLMKLWDDGPARMGYTLAL